MPDAQSMIERVARIDQDINPPFSFIERLALAAMKVDYPDEFREDGSLDESGQIYWHKRGAYYVETARAVLTAMRESTETMNIAAHNAFPFAHSEHPGISSEIWTKMIDAALEEGR